MLNIKAGDGLLFIFIEKGQLKPSRPLSSLKKLGLLFMSDVIMGIPVEDDNTNLLMGLH